mmetsp:Transcript_26836/g.72381  ORF Transcript_26836/g.72381 Transcript_26836/m.72381 type:complete len:204 (-) Transcript_26836:826-1437(-)
MVTASSRTVQPCPSTHRHPGEGAAPCCGCTQTQMRMMLTPAAPCSGVAGGGGRVPLGSSQATTARTCRRPRPSPFSPSSPRKPPRRPPCASTRRRAHPSHPRLMSQAPIQIQDGEVSTGATRARSLLALPAHSLPRRLWGWCTSTAAARRASAPRWTTSPRGGADASPPSGCPDASKACSLQRPQQECLRRHHPADKANSARQ